MDATIGTNELSEEIGTSEELEEDTVEEESGGRIGSSSSEEKESMLEFGSNDSHEEGSEVSLEEDSTTSTDDDSMVSSEEGVVSENAEETVGEALHEKSERTANVNIFHAVFPMPTNYTPISIYKAPTIYAGALKNH